MNRFSIPAAFVSGVILIAAPVEARPVKRPAVRAKAAAVVAAPAPAVSVIGSDGTMTPVAVQLQKPTPAEVEANAVWSLRAALNIAALQCQFSPFLATVSLYNAALAQHGEEFDRARVTMTSHFRRYDGARASNSFDQYTTRTYNSFSTLDAQFAFCERAARAGRDVLTVRKGQLGSVAQQMTGDIRSALTPVSALAMLGPVAIDPIELPAF